MKNNLILAITLFLSIPLMGQDDFRSGFIIKQNGDTVRGLINLRSNVSNSKQCEFKENKTDKEVIYSPGEIKGYRIESLKYYVSREIKIDSTNKSVFLEFLVDGIADLYFLRHEEKDYYYIEKNGELFELTSAQEILHYKPQSITEARRFGNGADTYYKKSTKYIGILNIAYGDCPDLKTKINRTSFSYGSLINLTKDYHEKMCTDYTCIDYSKSSKKKIFIEPVAGIISSKLGLETSSQTKNYTTYIVGANIRFLPIQSHYVWNLIIGVNYSQTRLEEIFSHNLGEAIYIDDITWIKTNYSIIRFPISVDYTLPVGKLSPFICGTFTNCILVNDEYDARSYDRLGESYERHDLTKFQFGFGGGVGIKYKSNDKNYFYLKCDYEYRKSASSTMEVFDYLRCNSIICTLGFGFRL